MRLHSRIEPRVVHRCFSRSRALIWLIRCSCARSRRTSPALLLSTVLGLEEPRQPAQVHDGRRECEEQLDSVETLVIKTREAASDPFVLERVARADALFIAGGIHRGDTMTGNILDPSKLAQLFPPGAPGALAAMGELAW